MGDNKKRRKSKSAAIYIPIAALLILFLVILGTSVFLKIIVVEVNGAIKYKDSEIINASGIEIGNNMLFINADTVRQRILSSMPYINEASIEFNLPDRVVINVIESIPIAVIGYRGSVLVIDSTGRILDQVDTAPEGLIEVRGFTPAEARIGNALRADMSDESRFQRLREVLAAIERESMADDVSFVDVSNISYINFFYLGRITVILGDTDNLRNKLGSLDEIIADYERSNPRYERYTINMRDREGWRVSPER